MKLILTAEVDHLGSSGDIVEVKDGYGRNFLLPRGLAIVASRGAERQADEIRRGREIKSVKGREHANELKIAIEGLGPVELSVKAAGVLAAAAAVVVPNSPRTTRGAAPRRRARSPEVTTNRPSDNNV